MIEVLLNSKNAQGGAGTIQVRHLLGASVPVDTISGIITDPAGGIIPVNFQSNVTFLEALPTNVEGNIIYGDYKVNLSYDGTDYDGTYELCDRRSSDYQLFAEIQCLLGVAEIKDGGKYPANATVERSFRIRRTAVATFDEDARDQSYDTVNRPRHRIEVAYGGVDYTFDVSGRAEWIANDVANLQFVELFQTSSLTKLADCRKSLCIAADCLNKFVTTKINTAVACNSGIKPTDLAAVTQAQVLFTRLQVAIECYDVTGAGEIYADLERVIGKCVCRDCGDHRVVRIGYDVAIGLANRMPISRLHQAGSSQRVTETGPGTYAFSNVVELDELAGKVLRRGNGRVDVDLTMPGWSSATLKPEFRTGGGIDSSSVRYRRLNSLGGQVQIQGFLETGTEVYTDGAIITSSPLPEAFRVGTNGKEDSFPFVLWKSNREVAGSVMLTAEGHLRLRTNTPRPQEESGPGGGGDQGVVILNFWFTMTYDPALGFTFIQQDANDNNPEIS